MKRGLVLWLIILLVPLALATTSTQTLKVDTPAVVNGKTITLKYVEANMIILEVDGFSGRYSLTGKVVNDTMIYSPNISLSGVFIRVFEIFEKQNEIKAEITVTFTCGNKICESNETSFCCKDCNCTTGYSCIDNQCIDSALNECLNDSQCNDNNNCTADSCSGVPRKCTHAIKACKDYDFCCPQGCTFDNDSDCPKTGNSCRNNTDCNDNDPCTQDICNISINTCNYTTQKGCGLNQSCYAIGSAQLVNNISSYCAETGWKQKKFDNETCTRDYECLNKCVIDKCATTAITKIKEKKPITTYVIIGAIILILIMSLIRYSVLKKRVVVIPVVTGK